MWLVIFSGTVGLTIAGKSSPVALARCEMGLQKLKYPYLRDEISLKKRAEGCPKNVKKKWLVPMSAKER